MRKLKFRAWVGSENTDFIDMPSHYEYGITIVNGEYADVEAGWDIHGTYENVPIEQYTGLKDKNGKEIYEGDIVKARWYRAKNARLDTKGEVKFDDGWFYIYDDPDGQDRLGVPVHNCYNIEVIGNIHENKELLK